VHRKSLVTEIGIIMDTSLTVADRRHISLPDCALFAPTELQINPSLSQNEFSRLGKTLSSVDQASDLWACDYALAGQKRWGDEGLKIAAASTRLSVGYLKVSARIAERFDPARRFPGLAREHYRGLCCFPTEWTDKWLPTVAEKGFSAKTLRALAVEAYGSDPKGGYTKNKKRCVSVPETLYARLKESAPTPKVAVYCELILADFASNATEGQKERIAAALATRHADRTHEQRGWKTKREKKPKKEKPAPKEVIIEPADVRFQLEKFHKATYAERREAQIKAGAEPVPVKDRKYTSKVKIVFTECKGRSFIEEPDGTVKIFSDPMRVSRFHSQKAADAAAAEYSADRGYPCEGFICEKCSSILLQNTRTAYRKSVWHVRARSAAPASHGSDIMASANGAV
jgi:hypothetical protein